MRFLRLVVASLAVLIVLLSAGGAGAVSSRSDVRCLAMTLYWEARNETRVGMLAVASVVLNRVENQQFPNSVCAVVKEGGEVAPCQFSYWCDGQSDRPQNKKRWQVVKLIAHEFLHEVQADPTAGTLFYRYGGIYDPWQAKRERTVAIGRHVYYR